MASPDPRISIPRIQYEKPATPEAVPSCDAARLLKTPNEELKSQEANDPPQQFVLMPTPAQMGMAKG